MITRIIKSISQWYYKHKRSLPWRDEPSFYRVWISEIMLQQTQVKTVIPYFDRFIERFPDVHVLASASIDEVYQYWAGLGYYSRAKNLHQTAKIISDNNCYPKTRNEWLSFPGIGEYTAGAILSIANNLPEPILDGNVKRVIARLRCIRRTQGYIRKLWRWSGILISAANNNSIPPSDFNQALMEMGALVCKPSQPLCNQCPTNQYCLAYQRKKVDLYPEKPKRKTTKKIHENHYMVISPESKTLLVKNIHSRWTNGLWDTPELTKQIEELFESYIEVINVKYRITNHQITRKTILFRIQYHKQLESLKKYYQERGTKFALYQIDDLISKKIAYGAALSKTLKIITRCFI